ncbi:VOC family protein [Saccharopolyspora sp. NPDC000995]
MRTTTWPLIPYADKKAGIRFLVEAFGFEETLIVPGEDGDLVHAELRWPGGGIMIGTCDSGSRFAKPKGSGAAYVVTDAPDALFQRAVAAGAEVVHEPMTRTTARGSSPSGIRKATAGASGHTKAANRRTLRLGYE